MRVLKLAVISFVILFGLVTAMSLLIPANIRISKAINIKGERDTVLALVKEPAAWHPAFINSGQQGGVQNTTTLQVVAQTDSTVYMQWAQKNKKPIHNGWEVYQFAKGDSITLQWYMDFQLQWYPWQKFGSLFYENTFGAMMERGLTNLQAEVHARNRKKRGNETAN